MVSICVHSHGELSDQSQLHDAAARLSSSGGMAKTETCIYAIQPEAKFQFLLDADV